MELGSFFPMEGKVLRWSSSNYHRVSFPPSPSFFLLFTPMNLSKSYRVDQRLNIQLDSEIKSLGENFKKLVEISQASSSILLLSFFFFIFLSFLLAK